MAASFALLRDIRPYKTSWRIHVKIIHSWRQYTMKTGETLELILSDEKGVKIHASVKKDLVARYVNNLPTGEWRFIETFSLNHAGGQFRPTPHLYKMSFVNGTMVSRSERKSDSNYLSLVNFQKLLSGELNPNMLIDVIGQVVNIGELEIFEVNNKPTNKIDFEMRDESDERLPCTLWGSFAEKVFRSCQEVDGTIVVCVIRFAKIKTYKGIRSVSNSFDASQVHVNPIWPEVDDFKASLPSDGLTLTFRETVPKYQLIAMKEEDISQYPRKTIRQLFDSIEVGKVRLLCNIYGIDTDWAWYYFSCRICNKKVTHIHVIDDGVNSTAKKQKFWCEDCKKVVTNVVARFMVYIKVMDNTGESKFLLFDSIASEIIGESASSILSGALAEISNPEDLPEPLRNLIGKTFAFLVSVEKENICAGKESYRVSKVLSKDGLLDEEAIDDFAQMVNPESIVSGDQVPLALTYSQDTNESTTPSSKRVYESNVEATEQSSTSKKLCVQKPKLEKSEEEFGVKAATLNFDDTNQDKSDKKDDVDIPAKKVETTKVKEVKVKVEKE